MTGATYCSVYGCGNNSKRMPHLSFFGTPKDRERIKIWATRMGRPDILEKEAHKKFYVCSIHFVSDMFKNKRLKAGAVPALNLPAAASSLQHIDELKLHIPIQQISEGAGHASDDGNTVTELIYSEEHNDYIERSVKLHNTKKRTQTDKGKEDTKKSKQGNGSSDEPKLSNDEIDKFGKYIASLLKRMPRQLSKKLQYKIVNLIKDAKLEYGINDGCSSFEAMASTTSFSNILINQNNETYNQIDDNKKFAEIDVKPATNYTEVTEENADDDPLPAMQYVETCLGTSEEKSGQKVSFYNSTTASKIIKSQKHANETKNYVKMHRDINNEIDDLNETRNFHETRQIMFDNLSSMVQVKIEEYDPIDNKEMKEVLTND